jgi:hypothetical protein
MILEEKKDQLKTIGVEMESLKKSMLSLTQSDLIKEYEREWMKLNDNKKEIEESISNLKIGNLQEIFYEHLEKTLFVFDNLVDIWDNHNTDIKQLLLNVIFE